MPSKAPIVLTAVLATLCVAGPFAADWPNYQGPKRDGTSSQEGVLRSWPKDGPKVLWSVPLGAGFGGPAVKDGKVFLLDRDEAVGDTLRVYDIATGKELWAFAYDAPGRFMFNGSRTTPTIDGTLVYTVGPLGDLHAIDTVSHKVVWHKNIWTEFGGTAKVPEFRQAPPIRGAQGRGPSGPPPSPSAAGGAQGAAPSGPPTATTPPAGGPGGPGGPPSGPGGAPPRREPPPPGAQLPTWGITQNPLIYVDLLIVAPQTPQTTVVAFDKRTGELKWKSEVLSGGTGYVSPALVQVSGQDHLVMMTSSRGFGRNASGGSVNGLDPLTGKLLWTYGNWQCAIPVPHAVDAGHGRVLVTGGYLAGAAMLKVEKQADGTFTVAELFKNVNFGSHTQPPILYKDHFYAQYTINERSDGLVCMSMDGEVKWKTGEEPPFSKGGAVLADGVILAVDGNTKLYVVEPDPMGFKPLASAELLESGNNWSPIALVDGKLLIRHQKQMKCLQVAQ